MAKEIMVIAANPNAVSATESSVENKQEVAENTAAADTSAADTSAADTSAADTSTADISAADTSATDASAADTAGTEEGTSAGTENKTEEDAEQQKTNETTGVPGDDLAANLTGSVKILGQGMASIFVVLGIIAVFVSMLKKLDNKKKK